MKVYLVWEWGYDWGSDLPEWMLRGIFSSNELAEEYLLTCDTTLMDSSYQVTQQEVLNEIPTN